MQFSMKIEFRLMNFSMKVEFSLIDLATKNSNPQFLFEAETKASRVQTV